MERNLNINKAVEKLQEVLLEDSDLYRGAVEAEAEGFAPEYLGAIKNGSFYETPYTVIFQQGSYNTIRPYYYAGEVVKALRDLPVRVEYEEMPEPHFGEAFNTISKVVRFEESGFDC